jgi:hypothetical protein
MFLKLFKSIILLGGKMRIPFKSRLLLAIGISTIVFIAGCVDTSVDPIPNKIDYSSQLKVVNLVTGVSQAALTLNGTSLGTADFGNEVPGSGSAFLTLGAGSKTLLANFSSVVDTFKFSLDTDYKYRVFLVGTSSSSNAVRVAQRYIWQTKDSENGAKLFPADTGWVAFFNGSPDATLNSVSINGAVDTLDTDLGDLAMGGKYKYIKLAAGNYTFDVTYDSDQHVTFDYTVASKGRYTAVIYDAAASIKNTVFIDD